MFQHLSYPWIAPVLIALWCLLPVGRVDGAENLSHHAAAASPGERGSVEHADDDERSPKNVSTASPMPRAQLAEGLRSHDRALLIKSGWIRDPYIVRGPDDQYYLTGTTPLPDDPRQEIDPYNTGLGPTSIVGWKMQVWRSNDLIDWQPLKPPPFTLRHGFWFERDPTRYFRVPQRAWRLWAPELHFLGDRWAIVHTSPAPVNGANLALSRGSELAGPWSNPLGAAIGRRHDPSLFQDEDGVWWMIWGAAHVAPLKADFSGFADEPTKIGPSGATVKLGHEGCFIRRLGDKYVLFGTGWSSGQMRRGTYNLYYTLADHITGPYGPRQFAGRFLGHGTLFQDKEGKWWCTAFFNANHPPLNYEQIEERTLNDAFTINEQGVTIVPMEISIRPDGTPHVRPKDPRYARPGADEAQKFGLNANSQ